MYYQSESENYIREVAVRLQRKSLILQQEQSEVGEFQCNFCKRKMLNELSYISNIPSCVPLEAVQLKMGPGAMCQGFS